MKKINITRTAIVGIFIFLAVLLLIAAIFAVGNQQKAFVKAITVRSVFYDIEGLQEGNNVWLYGVKIGTIKKISFYGKDQVEVLMSIEKTAQTHIPKDARVKIGSDGLIGNKIIIIYGGTFAETIGDSDFLQSDKTLSSDDLMTTLQANNQNILAITTAIKDGKGTIGKLIEDPSIANGINTTVKNFQELSANSEVAIGHLNDYTAGLNKKGTLANELVTDTAVYANLIQLSNQLRDASLHVAGVTANLETASNGITQNNTPIGMMFNNKQVAGDLQTMADNLANGSKKLDEDLEAVQHNFLFKGYFKRLAKQKQAQIVSDSVHKAQLTH
jgi:phospholipid/cholesterol/gamma-HCH transport system substrate-binding protein